MDKQQEEAQVEIAKYCDFCGGSDYDIRRKSHWRAGLHELLMKISTEDSTNLQVYNPQP